MNKILLILLLTTGALSAQQIAKQFSSLDSFVVEGHIKLFYDKSTTEIINERIGDLPKKDPMYSDEFEKDDVLILKTKIDNKSKKYFYVVFTEGPSFDLAFCFYSREKKYIDLVPGSEIYIPGNGYLYTAGHNNNTFFQKRKFILKNDKFQEIKQPYYYVGLKTKTLKALRIYSDHSCSQVVADLPQNSDIEVLLAEQLQDYSTDLFYLLRTPFGLLGWVKIEGLQYKSDEIEGIFYNGD